MAFTVHAICTARLRGLYVLPRAEPEEVHTALGALGSIIHTALARYISHTVDSNCVEKLRVPDRGARRVGDRARRGVMTGRPGIVCEARYSIVCEARSGGRG